MPHLHRLIAHPLEWLTTCWYLRTRRETQAVRWSFPLYRSLFIWKWRRRVKLYLTTCFNLLPLIRTHNDWCPCSPSEYSIIKTTSPPSIVNIQAKIISYIDTILMENRPKFVCLHPGEHNNRYQHASCKSVPLILQLQNEIHCVDPGGWQPIQAWIHKGGRGLIPGTVLSDMWPKKKWCYDCVTNTAGHQMWAKGSTHSSGNRVVYSAANVHKTHTKETHRLILENNKGWHVEWRISEQQHYQQKGCWRFHDNNIHHTTPINKTHISLQEEQEQSWNMGCFLAPCMWVFFYTPCIACTTFQDQWECFVTGTLILNPQTWAVLIHTIKHNVQINLWHKC